MDKNQVIELIKQNRLGEAIDLIEKASSGTDLHTDIIMLASAYSDYAKKNRHATHDINTLEAKRNRITHQLLAYLDEVPEDALAGMSPPPAEAATSREREPIAAGPSAAAFPTNPPGSGSKPWIKYGLVGLGAIVALFLIIEFTGTSDPYDDLTDYDAVTAITDETETGEEYVDPEYAEAITVMDIEYIEATNGGGNLYLFENTDYLVWIETTPEGNTHRFEESSRDDTSIYVRDEYRGINLVFNLVTSQVTYSDDNGSNFKLYDITSYDTEL